MYSAKLSNGMTLRMKNKPLTKPQPKSAPSVYNRSGFTQEEIDKLNFLGVTISKWRQRNIKLYQHPTDETKVISVGEAIDNSMIVIALEDKLSYATALDYIAHGKVYMSE